jgi:hypothetical protein
VGSARGDETVIESIVRFVAGILFAIICWLIFIPVGFVLATPVVLLLVIWRGKGSFKGDLTHEYRRLWDFWKKFGVFMVPPW